MKEKVYIETSVISYLCSRPSRVLVVAANQEVTREWWEKERGRYDLFVSQFVTAEIRAGDEEAAAKRVKAIEGVMVLQANEASELLAREIIRQATLPTSVGDDVAHVATATVYGMDYLLTWNCAHIANPHWLKKMSDIVATQGYQMPVVCNPQALLEGEVE
jgi:predicted nucleic acid-binding protein